MAIKQNSFTNLGTDFAARARDITTCLREEGFNTTDVQVLKDVTIEPSTRAKILLNLRIDVADRGQVTNRLVTAITVSYTHLTLPTIYSV